MSKIKIKEYDLAKILLRICDLEADIQELKILEEHKSMLLRKAATLYRTLDKVITKEIIEDEIDEKI